MTGRGAARPATTPHGRESPAPAAVARGEPDESRTAKSKGSKLEVWVWARSSG